MEVKVSTSVAPAARSTSTRHSAVSALSVGELARRTGTTAKTLRYYESIGLLPAPARRPSGYRAYDASYEERLAFIASAKRLGLSLEEIRQVIDLSAAGSRPCTHVLALLSQHLRELDTTIAELQAFRTKLSRLHRTATRRHKELGGRVCGIIEHSKLELSAPLAATLERWRPRKAVVRPS